MATLNLYRAFLDLLPPRPLQIGTVIDVAVDGDTVAVQLPGGGILVAHGTAALATQVFVRDGLIEGQAPAYTVITIEV